MVPYRGYRVFLAFIVGFLHNANAREYCLDDFMDASCESGEVVVMDTARYGRMRAGVCNVRGKDIGCSTDVVNDFDTLCTGKQSCTYRVADNLRNPDDCPAPLPAYLQVSYSCHKELALRRQECHLPVDVPETKGILRLRPLQQNDCALSHSPLTLQAKSGQRFNLTMIDASLGTLTAKQNACPVKVGHIIDKANSRSVQICGGRTRLSHLVLSNGNRLEIIVNRGLNNPDILLQYEVLGCPDLDPVEGARMRRQDNKVIVECMDTGKEWELICEGNKWLGTQAQCTKGSPHIQHYKGDGKSGVTMSRETAVIVSGVVTLCASGVIVFVAVIQLFKTLGCAAYIQRRRKGYGLPPEFPSEEEYYDGQELPMQPMQPHMQQMSQSFVQITNPRPMVAPPAGESPSPTVMTLNSQYENMSTMSSKGVVYEPLELRSTGEPSIGRQRAPGVQSGRQGPPSAPNQSQARMEAVQTPTRQKYRGIAQTLKLRPSKQKKSSFRKSAPIQPPRVSSLIKEGSARQPAPKPTSTSETNTRSKRGSSAPVRRVPTPPPSPEEPAAPQGQDAPSAAPTYSVPLRNSMLQSEMPDVVYQTTEASYGPRIGDEEAYEVPVGSRMGSSSTSGASGSSSSGAGSVYAPVRLSDALTSFPPPPPPENNEEAYIYSDMRNVSKNSKNAPKPSKKPAKEPEIFKDPDEKAYTDLDLSKPIVIPTVLDVAIGKDLFPTNKNQSANQASQGTPVPAEESLYANVEPQRTNSTFNSSDYGALCDHSSNTARQEDTDGDEDVYACAKEYYVQHGQANGH